MMDDHTPGPWRAVPSIDETIVRIDRPRRPEEAPHWPGIIAGVWDEADARLIAATPDLLAALESLADEAAEGQVGEYGDTSCIGRGCPYQTGRWPRPHADDCVVRRARAAIAKARNSETAAP